MTDQTNRTANAARAAWELIKAAYPEAVSLLRYAVNSETAAFAACGESIMDVDLYPMSIAAVGAAVTDESMRELVCRKPPSDQFRFFALSENTKTGRSKLCWVDLPMREITGIDVN